jgi:group II intron reverse transcriptase/maturase
MESFGGKMGETSSSQTVSTKLERIARLAQAHPGMVLNTLAHHIDLDWMREAYRRTRKDGAVGVDGQTAAEYEANLEGNLRSLLDRAKSGTYKAPPVRRVYIPKSDGTKRPLGIPTLEDKILQRAVAMVLEAVYEQEFLACSYGFRPKRSAHGALEDLRNQMMDMHGGWVVELDIRKYFDTIDHHQLRDVLNRRVRDGVLLRLIGKWLNAGVMEDGALSFPKAGTPQGGVISPLLANVYLHEILDTWFEKDVKPRLKGRGSMIRYADDAVLVFSKEEDARRVLEVLPKRFEKYGLTLHPEKTRIVEFRRPPLRSPPDPPDGPGPGTFDFLGFTHFWAKSRKGNWVIKRRTAKSRFRRAIEQMTQWIRRHRHDPIEQQRQTIASKLRGHKGYYGITGNSKAVSRFFEEVKEIWHRWLGRRSQRSRQKWEQFRKMLDRFPLPSIRLKQPYCPT